MGNMDDRSQQVVAVTVLMIILVTLAVIFRLTARVIKGVSLGADDYTVLVALTLFYPLAAGNFVGVSYGLGKHFLDINIDDFQNFWKTTYWTLLLYSLDITATKFSILLLYHRIFPVRWLTNALWALGGIASAWCIATFITQIFSCLPIKYYWDFFIPGGGRCIRLFPYFISASALNAAIDVVMLLLPVSSVYGLQMPLRRKLVICGLFLLGGLVCVATIIRTYYYTTMKINDITYTSSIPSILTVVEPGVGIICACLPVMPPVFTWASWSRISSLPLLRQLYSRISSRTNESKSTKESTNASRSRKRNVKMDVLFTTPAETWKWRTMSAIHHAEDGLEEQDSRV